MSCCWKRNEKQKRNYDTHTIDMHPKPRVSESPPNKNTIKTIFSTPFHHQHLVVMLLLWTALLIFGPGAFRTKLASTSTSLRGQLYDFVAGNELTQKERLDVYLAGEIKQHSRSFLSDLCEKGRVTVNGKQQTKNYKVTKGDKVVVDIDVKEDTSTVTPEYIPLDILYEDEHIIAVNKPNGMVVHPAVGSPNGTFVNALLYHLGDAAQSLLDITSSTSTVVEDDDEEGVDGDNVDLPETPEAAVASPQRLRPGIVHRLDKGTSGVLLAAKHPEAVTKLSGTHTNTLTHSFTHSLTYSLTHSLTHSHYSIHTHSLSHTHTINTHTILHQYLSHLLPFG